MKLDVVMQSAVVVVVDNGKVKVVKNRGGPQMTADSILDLLSAIPEGQVVPISWERVTSEAEPVKPKTQEEKDEEERKKMHRFFFGGD